MTPKLNSELSEALRQQAGPLEVQDALGEKSYVIVSKEQYRKLLEHEFREWIRPALEQDARDEAQEWNVEEVLAEAHRRFEARQNS